MASAWQLKRKFKTHPNLRESVSADVCIIGGGLCGILSAYLLSKEGVSVVLLEKERLLESTTLYTTAHITKVIDTSLTDLVKIFGKKKSRLVWEAGDEAIDLIEEIVKKENIDCEFMRASAHIFSSEPGQQEAIEDDVSTAHELGFTNIRLRRPSYLPFENYGSMEVPRQAKFHPIKFARALVKAAQKNGVKFYERSEAKKIEKKKSGIYVVTPKGKVLAKKVLVSTHQPFNNPKEVKLKKGMYVSYVIEYSLSQRNIEEALYWNYANPYHYLRVDDLGKSKRAILGGEDHRKELKGLKNKSFKALNEYGEDLLGSSANEIRRWTGPILEPIDGLALIGEYDPQRFIATAFSGNGITYSGVAALMFKDYVLGSKNAYRDVFDPTRIPTAKQLALKGKDYVQEFMGGAAKNIFK